jgi:hypothetical protein
MLLTLEALTILDAIERKGSFARAAEELARAPSSLTYAVQQMEADLDVLLFDRSGHRARFTPAGRVLLEEGRSLLAAANRWCKPGRLRWLGDGFTTRLRHFAGSRCCRCSMRRINWARLPRSSCAMKCWRVVGTPACGRADLGSQATRLPQRHPHPRWAIELCFAWRRGPLARVNKPLSQADIAAHRAV